jgi:hypothetical protein
MLDPAGFVDADPAGHTLSLLEASMRRLTALALVLVVGNASMAVAGETLLESASRVARETANLPGTPINTASRVAAPRTERKAELARTVGRTPQEDIRAALQGPLGAPALETSGMGKGRKWMIAGGVIAALAAIMLTIDGNVEDPTPSTAGTREDGL